MAVRVARMTARIRRHDESAIGTLSGPGTYSFDCGVLKTFYSDPNTTLNQPSTGRNLSGGAARTL